VTGEEAREPLVADEPADEVVGHRGDRVVSPEPLVEGVDSWAKAPGAPRTRSAETNAAARKRRGCMTRVSNDPRLKRGLRLAWFP
jgi:hypothetical protein